MLDTLIRRGLIVDGTGRPGYVGDVGITDGRIVAVGDIDEPARQVIDATGRVVTPGFIDPHTHYDAQLFWDARATPSNLHGVTSVIAGNCGFTLAPSHLADADYLRQMMAKVEGMPLAALEQGVDWDWESFADYLSRLDGKVAVNAGFLVGHCALRHLVMGADAVGHEATPEQVAAMRDQLAAAIESGGLGLSTTRSFTHSDAAGEPVASRWATAEELLELCAVVSEHEGTTLELVTDGCLTGFSEEEVELMVQMSLVGQRPVNWNVLTIDAADPDRYYGQLAPSERAAERGGRVVALTMPVLVGMNMSFLTFCALNNMPDWAPILGLPVPERIERLRDPETRRFLEERAASPDAGVFSRLTGWSTYVIGDTYSAANEGLKGRVVGDVAAERGTSAFDTLLDIVIEDDLRTVLWPAPTDNDDDSWQLRAQAWSSPHTMVGGSDAGAHLDRMCGSSYTTAWLADVLRGRQLTTLEDAVRHLTQVPAELFGLRDRGRLEPGAWADVVVLDPDTVGAGEVVLVHDLPGGAGRLYAEAIGIEKVLVNGTLVVDEGEATDALPGTILRSGTDTETVRIPAAR